MGQTKEQDLHLGQAALSAEDSPTKESRKRDRLKALFRRQTIAGYYNGKAPQRSPVDCYSQVEQPIEDHFGRIEETDCSPAPEKRRPGTAELNSIPESESEAITEGTSEKKPQDAEINGDIEADYERSPPCQSLSPKKSYILPILPGHSHSTTQVCKVQGGAASS